VVSFCGWDFGPQDCGRVGKNGVVLATMPRLILTVAKTRGKGPRKMSHPVSRHRDRARDEVRDRDSNLSFMRVDRARMPSGSSIVNSFGQVVMTILILPPNDDMRLAKGVVMCALPVTIHSTCCICDVCRQCKRRIGGSLVQRLISLFKHNHFVFV
jgi:hypothetical protein